MSLKGLLVTEESSECGPPVKDLVEVSAHDCEHDF